MTNNRRTLALIYGGIGAEREVSISGMRFVLPLIDKEKYNILPVLIDTDSRWLINDDEVTLTPGGFIYRDEFVPIDVAFPLLHGDYGEDGVVQGALDNALIPYVGCDTVSGGAARDKAVMKEVAASLDIPTLPWRLILASDDLDMAVLDAERTIGYPMFIKPSRLGSSVGTSFARNRESLIIAINTALRFGSRVIIEKMLSPLRELECAFLSVDGEEIFTPPGEILCDGFYDYNTKYSSGDNTTSRADIPPEISSTLIDYSDRLVRAVGIRQIARIDFFLSEGRLYFNEINTMPGFTATSLYPRMIARAGIPPATLVERLIDGAMANR